MKIGTRSILYGVHAFWLHPFQLAYAWYTMYGFPWDPRLWIAFIVHDLGYVGKPNMDGEEGERHPEWGAELMGDLFDPSGYVEHEFTVQTLRGSAPGGLSWYAFCLLHSRFYAKRYGFAPSRLCFADKLVFLQTPWWVYRLLANWSGEINEYMDLRGAKYHDIVSTANQYEWFKTGQDYCRRWIEEHRYGKSDSWTKVQQEEVKHATTEKP